MKNYENAPTQEPMRTRGMVRKFRTSQRDITKTPRPASVTTAPISPAGNTFAGVSR